MLESKYLILSPASCKKRARDKISCIVVNVLDRAEMDALYPRLNIDKTNLVTGLSVSLSIGRADIVINRCQYR